MRSELDLHFPCGIYRGIYHGCEFLFCLRVPCDISGLAARQWFADFRRFLFEADL